MGRYLPTLSVALADAAQVSNGTHALDVGCGPGGLTRELTARGARVAAIDPSPPFAAACGERYPDADVRVGGAEALPWDDDTFDATLASLVVAFMQDPELGVSEMARVTRPGGTVAACMWDIAGGRMNMLRIFWTAVAEADPDAAGEQRRPGTTEGDLVQRFAAAGLGDVRGEVLTARAEYADFDDFWEPFTYGVGPAGAYLAAAPDDRRATIREACRAQLPEGSFELDAHAWCAVGTA